MYSVLEMVGQWWVVYDDGTNVEYHFNEEKENSRTNIRTHVKVTFCEGKQNFVLNSIKILSKDSKSRSGDKTN